MVATEQQLPAADGNHVEGSSTEEGLIADAARLEAFCCMPAAQRPPLDATTRGVLAETALTGLQRYEWRLLLPLLHRLVDSVLADFTPPPQQDEEVGPPRPPLPGFESLDDLTTRLHSLLNGLDEAPFTLQRLCEVLLEPRKQYARLDKVVLAIEKLLMVTSTRQVDPPDRLPPPPALATLTGVNNNPPSPYLDGRPPAVLDQEQHAALLQAQAAAMAVAQQHLQQQQQQHGRQLSGMANGLDEGPSPLEVADEQPHAAAAEAMQVDVPPVSAAAAAAGGPHAAGPPAISAAEAASAAQFVESALADSDDPAGAAATTASSSPQAPSVGPVTLPEQKLQQSPTPSPSGKGPDGPCAALPTAVATAAAVAPTSRPPSMDVAMEPAEKPLQEQQQQQLGPQPMDHSPGDTDAGGAVQLAPPTGIGEVIARIQQHLPPSLQAVLLPPLLQQQRWQQIAAGETSAVPQARPGGNAASALGEAAAAAASDASALCRLVVSGLTELPHDKASAVLSQLQPLLPAQVQLQLQQQQVQ